MAELEINEKSTEEKNEKSLDSRTQLGMLTLLFRYSDMKDILLMGLGMVGCMADGSSTPLIMLVLSKTMNNYSAKSSVTITYIIEVEGLCWARTSERQTSRLRRKYLRAVIRQDAGFLDTMKGTSTTYQTVSCISTDTLTIQSVLSEKVPNFLMNIATFTVSQLVSLYLCWKLAVITIPALLLLLIPGIIYGNLLAELGKKIQEAYRNAGGIAEQAFSSIRTVVSNVADYRTQKDFSAALETSLELGIKQGLMKGLAIGSVGVAFAVWSFQAWYGSILVTEHGARGGDVFTAGVCIVVGGLALGSSLVNVKYFTEATTAASLIFEMIERVPSIDNEEKGGQIIKDVKGELEFKDVSFAYPSRKENLVLRNFNLRVKSGQTVGLVGGSGSGKSTIISLIERFYDPLKGEIYLDTIDVKKLQLKWLRCHMGLVSQEPILFATTIKENILIGKESASMEEVISASKAAYAHSFISQLPEGYDTNVGQYGSQMSGGQKQRIAIARALLRDPKILLLDEATSALDSQSEKAVQEALDEASEGRTTIIVAHRLSTLRNASLIAVIQSGQVVESGSHEQLIGKGHGQYSAMVQIQQMTNEDDWPLIPQSTSGSLNSYSMIQNNTDESNKLFPVQLLDKTDQHKDDISSTPSLWHLVKMTRHQWKSTLFGCTAALWFGAVQPFHSFCMGALLSVYFLEDPSAIRSETELICLAFICFAIITLISNIIQHYNFGVMGEHLTKRIREAMLAKVLTFEIEWFDHENNSSGALCSRLSTEANLVRSLVCDRLSLFAQVFSAAIIAVALSMALAWRLAIVIISLQPIIIGSFYGRGVLMKTMSKKVLKAQTSSSKLASEAVRNHKTIAAYSSEEHIMGLFNSSLEGPKSESLKQSWYAGLGLFISQFLTAANTGLIVWYGGRLLIQGKITYKHLFQTFFILVTTGRVIAEAGSVTSDLTKGRDAVKAMFMTLDRKSKMHPDDPKGTNPQTLQGSIELHDVYFAYPSRPKQTIFMGLSLKIDYRTTVALVGRSGSGKSSIISLINRFYDPLKGSVEIDGVDIKSYNLRALRSYTALVSQEPTLFAGTIFENIIYGKENATETEVIEAATLANAHEFISGMKDGYSTYCGERGMQLSGGQKQRICIARAILKNPAILLLDEATSALDSRSESLVQDALEKIMTDRTCVVVAHRLSTIQKADTIAVIDNGRVAENGSHSELLAKGDKGSYYAFVRLQQYKMSEPQEVH
ncbi:hypothetical protein AQUCO_05600043v1 [Aquilegia coerulea]|uniref:Multidrug resistance protein n=1 Tax=Aquilegia coerulea TaxID=218851 RepID=A0A2G5CGB9_AQUCA|nr:hypothetical protein AQUCO_05600043v1 [Aquilegia coerulea]